MDKEKKAQLAEILSCDIPFVKVESSDQRERLIIHLEIELLEVVRVSRLYSCILSNK